MILTAHPSTCHARLQDEGVKLAYLSALYPEEDKISKEELYHALTFTTLVPIVRGKCKKYAFLMCSHKCGHVVEVLSRLLY